MPTDSSSVVLFDGENARAVRSATALAARTAPVDRARAAGAGASFVLAFAAPAAWPRLVLRLGALRPRALGVVPLGPPTPLPFGSSAIARFLLPSQAAARAWGPYIPLGRLVVVEPAPPARATPGGVYCVTAPDLQDPEGLVAAARGGAAFVCARERVGGARLAEDLPLGTVITEQPEAESAHLRNDPSRLAALGKLAERWAAIRNEAAEAAAIRALRAEVLAMATRGGRSG